MPSRLQFGRYDYAAYCAFTVYASCALILPVLLVSVARDLDFPLDAGGMASGGALNFASSMTMCVVLVGCSAIAARFGKRLSMGCSMLLMGGGTLACAFMPRYWMLFPCLLVAGLGHGVCEGIATPFVQDLHAHDAPERYVSISHGFWSVGTAFCVVFAGGLQALGVPWRAIIGLMGALTMLTSLWFLLPESPGRHYPEREGGLDFAQLLRGTAAIARDPAFANIVCRCETVTEAEIRDAIRRTIGARTVDGVKRRTRAGMGRCQGGFCQPKVVAILADELHLPPEEILKDQPGSNILPPLR